MTVESFLEMHSKSNYRGIGHCCVGFIDGAEPEAKDRKEGRVFWAE